MGGDAVKIVFLCHGRQDIVGAYAVYAVRVPGKEHVRLIEDALPQHPYLAGAALLRGAAVVDGGPRKAALLKIVLQGDGGPQKSGAQKMMAAGVTGIFPAGSFFTASFI